MTLRKCFGGVSKRLQQAVARPGAVHTLPVLSEQGLLPQSPTPGQHRGTAH